VFQGGLFLCPAACRAPSIFRRCGHADRPPFQQIAFILEIDRLKQVNRQTLIADASRRENDAEHSWHLAMWPACSPSTAAWIGHGASDADAAGPATWSNPTPAIPTAMTAAPADHHREVPGVSASFPPRGVGDQGLAVDLL